MGKDSLTRQPAQHLSISVIICTFERSSLLRICLDSLLQSSPPNCPWEIIVVDNDSRDDTPGVIREFKAKLSNLTSITINQRNLSAARNTGCESAAGTYLVYLDDDAKIPEEYLTQVEACLLKNGPDLMSGPVFPYYSKPKPSWFRDSYETKKFTKVSQFCGKTRVTGANFIIRKDVLKLLGMFDLKRGMQGKRYVIGDERKVLETYRSVTPLEAQKVYYSLECFVYHHVDPRKLKLYYFLYRYFVGGYTTQLIRFELGDRPRSFGVVLKGIFCWAPETLVQLARAARKRSRPPEEVDLAMLLALRMLNLGELFAAELFWINRRLRTFYRPPEKVDLSGKAN